MGDDVTEALYEELQGLDADSALSLVSRWLTNNNLMRSADALKSEAQEEPAKWSGEASGGGSMAQPASTTPKAPPVGEALPVPGTSTRPGRLFDAEPIDPASVPESLLTKPDPVFFGERDDKRREQSAIEEFPLMVSRRRPTPSLEYTHAIARRVSVGCARVSGPAYAPTCGAIPFNAVPS